MKLLYKDEVRVIGRELGLPEGMVERQPFPGPGLGVRCLGAITRDRLEAVRESDAILREEFAKAGLEGKVWQYFTVVPDFKSVGVHEGVRTFDWPVILRAVNTVDAMTATVEDVPFALLQKITQRITSEVKGVNRVLYDLTPKPSGTIEWNEKYRRPVDAGLLYFALLLLSVVYLQAMEHFDKAGIIVADDLAMPHI